MWAKTNSEKGKSDRAMTREEAVEVLKERYLTCVCIGLDNHANRVNEAVDMAIEALSAVCDDCIWNVCNYNKVDWDAPSADRSTKHTLPDGTKIPIDEESYEIGYTEGQMADRPTGEWVSNHDGSWNCSKCGLRVFVYAKGNFCPNCGADMRHKGSDGE